MHRIINSNFEHWQFCRKTLFRRSFYVFPKLEWKKRFKDITKMLYIHEEILSDFIKIVPLIFNRTNTYFNYSLNYFINS